MPGHRKIKRGTRLLTLEEREFLGVVGKRIRAARKKRELTQTQLGKLIDKSQASVSNYELGEDSPSLLAIAQICHHLRADAAKILRP